MRAESGSVLAGTLGLGMVMTISAAGLLMIAGNVQQAENVDLREDRRFFAAESGLLMGARWLREVDSLRLRNFDLPITNLTGGYKTLEGIPDAKVHVFFVARPDSYGTVVSRAVSGPQSDTLELEWQVVRVDKMDQVAANSKRYSFLTLSDWKETLKPYNPGP